MRVDSDSLMYVACSRGLIGDAGFRTLVMLACHMDSYGIVRMSQVEMARMMGVSRVAMAGRLRELEERGFISRQGRSLVVGEHLFWKGKRTSSSSMASEYVHRLTKRALAGGVTLTEISSI